MQSYKKILLWGFGFGVGLATVLSLVWCGFYWHSSRPRPWNTKAITATFDRLHLDPTNKTYQIAYIFKNNTNDDYSLSEQSEKALTLNLEKQRSIAYLDGENSEFLTIDPVFIPAHQSAQVFVNLLQGSKVKYPGNDASSEEFEKFRVELKKELSKEAENINGFVLYDKGSKYQIIMPKGW